MSIDTKQIIHIASEIAVIGGITVYFMNKTNKLSEKIEELQELIQQQQESIQQHDNLILKLMNNLNTLNSQNLNNIKFNNDPKNKLPSNLMSKNKVVIMIPPKPENTEPLSNKVEEINDYDLDYELEEELKDLNDLNEVEDLNKEQDVNEEEDLDVNEENLDVIEHLNVSEV